MIDREEKRLGQALSAIGRRRGAGPRYFLFALWFSSAFSA